MRWFGPPEGSDLALRRATDRGVWVLVAAFLVLGVVYSVATPLFEASDELWHYPFVKHLADGHGLPVQDPDNPGPWRQEGSQPPLYYFLAALASRWAPSDDLDELLQPNPHASVGIVRPDGNANVVVHAPGEAFPYRGAALAVHLVRGVSVVLGALTVWFAYLLGCELQPQRPGLALAGAAVVAFTPMFLFISGSVNNDNLVVALSTAWLWLMLRTLRQPPDPGRWALLGALVGLAALSKVSALALAPLAALTLARVAWRRRDWRVFVWGGACLGGAALLVAGWWYYRNWRLYGDPLGWNVFLAISRPRARPPTLAQLWSELPGLGRSYWGVFGWLNVSAPPWFYRLSNGLTLLGAGGLLLGLGRLLLSRRWPAPEVTLRFGLVAGWPLIVLAALIRWTSLTMGTQGRLLFPAIAPLSYLMVLGFSGWGSLVRLPSNVKRQTSDARFLTFDVSRWTSLISGLTYLPPILLAVLAAWIPFGVIAPAYTRPPLLTPAEQAAIPRRLDLTFGDRMELLGYDLDTEQANPGQDLKVTLYWRALGPMDRNYSVFIHLLDENGLKIAQRDAYPGGGTFPTTLWRPGDAIADIYFIPVPVNTFNPNRLSIQAGLYELESGGRLPVRDREGHQWGDSVRFGQVLVRAEPKDGIANPAHFNLENRVALVGYDLDRTAMRPGEALHLTLLWKALAPVDGDYTVSARLLGVDGVAWGQVGGSLADASSGAGWEAGQVISSTHALALRPDAPDGVYYVDCSLRAANAPGDLSVLDRWGQPQDDRAVLTRIRVARDVRPEVAEPAFAFPAIENPLDVAFGDVARLRGFRLDQETVSPAQELGLTLYWEAIHSKPLALSYVVFTHLLDPENRVLAQHDGIPSYGYWPTTAWLEGQAIVDRHYLAFIVDDYEGEGLLEVGLYDPKTLQRLPTSEGGYRVILPVRVVVRP